MTDKKDTKKEIAVTEVIESGKDKKEDKSSENGKYWMKLNSVLWAVILVVSAFVFFPGFIALVIIWAMGKIKVQS